MAKESAVAANDPLIDLLNGEGAPYVDEAPVQSPARDQELDTNPKPLDPIKAADARHSTKAGGAGYKVRVKGEFYAKAPDASGKKIKKNFDEWFNVVRLEGCLSLIKNKMLAPALRKKFPDFVADRTSHIVECHPLSPATPKSTNLAYMNRDQLVAYVQSSSPAIPIDASSFPATDEGTTALRETIIDYVQNPNGFPEREAKRQADRKELAELASMNPGLDLAA